MKSLREMLFGMALAGTTILAALCVLGAFLGADRAKEFFDSWPLAVFWIALLVLLAVSVVASPNIRRRVGSLAMHAGPILILLGALLGSDKAHELAHRYFHGDKIAGGYMQIGLGQQMNDVFDVNGQVAGQLPFRLCLRGYRNLYYPWQLWAAAPSGGGQEEMSDTKIAWKLGKEVAIPWTTAKVTVLEYIDSGQPLYAGGVRGMLLIQAGERAVALPGKVGEQAKLAEPAMTIRIAKVFSRMRVVGSGAERVVVEDTAGPENPAVQIELVDAKGDVSRQYVAMAQGMHAPTTQGATFQYVPNSVSGFQADPATGAPGMRIRLRRDGGDGTEIWMTVPAGADKTGLSPAAVLGPTGLKAEDATSLWLLRLDTPIRQYQSDVSVMVDGREVARQVIDVNHPLSYGGYSFTQRSYDKENLRYTVLGVKSDTGLELVYIGMVVVCAGAIWFFWIAPAAGYLRRERTGNGH